MTLLRWIPAVAAAVLAGCSDQSGEVAVTPERLAELRTQSAGYADTSVTTLRGDAKALGMAQELYAAHCAACHGSAAEGTQKAPAFKGAVFNFGDDEAAILTTVRDGRTNVMPGWGKTLGEVELGATVAYVQSFSNGKPMDVFGSAAKEIFDRYCVTCHGAQGKGDPARGIPDLTDAYWQHGSSMIAMRLNITRGVESSCPARHDLLNDVETKLLTAWVLQQR